MNEKFKYAPGKPGFGSKGDPGINGHQGLSMYFTDYDPTTQSISINDRIANNQTLWVTSPISLPDGRVYVTGDLFFDNTGKAYEIDASTSTFTYKFASLNLGGLFLPLGVSSSEGYQRYFNSNSGQKYIIDNVYTSSGAINYTTAPSNIYSILPINFTRIEYTNVKPGGIYNPFTTYTIGSGDNDALAVVYDETNSKFRIGNLANDGSVRNTNLTFDISALMINRENNPITSDSLAGTILTNYEIAANSLFDPNFNSNPDSFFGGVNGTDCSISWILYDFTPDTNITADLYFYQYIDSYSGAYTFDSSALHPLIFSNIDSSGSISISQLTPNTGYAFYIKLKKNGWVRSSDTNTIVSSVLGVAPTRYDPCTYEAVADVGFSVTSMMVPWRYSFVQNPSSFVSITSCTSLGGSPTWDGSIHISLDENYGVARVGKLWVIPTIGTGKVITINQPSYSIPVTIDASLSAIKEESGDYWKATFFYTDSVKAVGIPSGTYTNVTMQYTLLADINDPDQPLMFSGHTLRIRNAALTALYTKTWPTQYFELGGVDTVNQSITINNVPSTAWPLIVEMSGVGRMFDAPAVTSGLSINVGSINVSYVSGTPVTITQTAEDFDTDLTLKTASPGYTLLHKISFH